jgi:hypothetical protein
MPRNAHRARRILAGLLLAAALPPDAHGQTLHSAHVDTANAKIVVKGSDLDLAAGYTLGGVAVATANVSPAMLDIPFDATVASAVPAPGSYRLNADAAAFLSLYFGAAVEIPGEPPPPPPPPPPAGPDCPCITGWQASGIPKDNFTLCYFDYSGPQQWIAGQRNNWFISAAFDPNNLFFDPADPGNSISYCALHDGTDWTVAEPVVNQDQFDDCDHWLWLNICI